MSKVKQSRFSLLLGVLVVGLFARYASGLNQKGWSVIADAEQEILTIKHGDLGLVIKDARLALREKGKLSRLSGWSVKEDKDKLNITTKLPKSTTWRFEITEEGLDVNCSDKNGVVSGIAPASQDRIPARVESPDNEIVYTSLGFVSAENIYSLFDRKTDTMIQFPEESDLSRNPSDEKVMDLIFPVIEGTEVCLIPDYYIKVLGLKYYRPRPKRFKTAPTGWCSWYCYYMNPTEEDIADETDVLAEKLKPYGLEYVQLDACYTRGKRANWLEWYKKLFPDGGKWLFQYIRDKGLKPGLWLNAYGANYAKPACADKYPENFFLRDKNKSLSGACCTADKTVVKLDYTNPEVIEKHLKPLFRTLVNDWGLKYLKDAGWGQWIDFYEANKETAYDPSKSGREVYRKVQHAIREVLGSDVYINGCAMHEVGLCFGDFDGSRVGGDDRADWEGMQVFFHSIFGANYLHNITWDCDPDCVLVRFPLTIDEGRTIVSSIALTGQTYMASDFMAKLPEEKLELYKKTIPTTEITPIDLYPFRIEANRKNGVVWSCPKVSEFPRALDLKVNAQSGIYDVVAVYNWFKEEDSIDISFGEDLGLDSKKEYLVFDFWDQELVGILKDEICADVPSHGVRVLVVRPFLHRPQLLATSRHITGAYSIKELAWDSSKFTLNGISRTVPDAPYSLFVYLPKGVSLSKVDANAEVLFHKITNGLLEVAFQGQEAPIKWRLEFSS